MQAFVRRNALLVFGLLFFVVLSGCSPYAVDDILRTRDADTYQYRVDRDVERFVQQVHRGVRLDRRQARDLDRLLRDRTYRLLDRTRSMDHHYVYPFPRRDYRNMNRAQRQFWNDADRWIDRRLSYQQSRKYAEMTGRSRARVRPYGERYEPRRRTSDRRYLRGDARSRSRDAAQSRNEDAQSRNRDDARSRNYDDARSGVERLSPRNEGDGDRRTYRRPTDGREEGRERHRSSDRTEE